MTKTGSTVLAQGDAELIACGMGVPVALVEQVALDIAVVATVWADL